VEMTGKCSLLLPLYRCPLMLSYTSHVLTGSYHNYFRIYDTDTLSDVVLQADKSAFKAKRVGGPLPVNKIGVKNGRPGGLKENMALDTLDFNKKILHASWHPKESTIAVSPLPPTPPRRS
jgi:serine/threonine-protein phosphatase 2A regulatory subunit B